MYNKYVICNEIKKNIRKSQQKQSEKLLVLTNEIKPNCVSNQCPPFSLL